MAPQQPKITGITSHFPTTKPAKLTPTPNQKPPSKPDQEIPENVAAKLRTYRNAHNEVESRVNALEQIALPYQEFQHDTRTGIALMREARAEILGKRKAALEEIGSAVSGAEERLREVGEMSTGRLARVLLARLEDGDSISDGVRQSLCEVLLGAGCGGEAGGVKRSREGQGEASMLRTPPDEGNDGAGERVGEGEPALETRRRGVSRTPPKQMSTRSQAVLHTSSDATEASSAPDEAEERSSKRSRTTKSSQEESLDSSARHESEPRAPEVAGELAPRRSERHPHPTKRQRDFVTWREIKASQEGKRR